MPECKLHTLQSLVFHYTQATNKDQKDKLFIIIYENEHHWFPSQNNKPAIKHSCPYFLLLFFTSLVEKKKNIWYIHLTSHLPSFMAYLCHASNVSQSDFAGNLCSCWSGALISHLVTLRGDSSVKSYLFVWDNSKAGEKNHVQVKLKALINLKSKHT